MSLRNLFRMVCLAVVVATTGQVQAGFINNSFGLSNPSTTITFDEFVFSPGTSITTQYSTLNVEFTPNLRYDPVPDNLPNISGHRLGNFIFGNPAENNPFRIKFLSVQTDVAFAMVTGPSNSAAIGAFLNGVLVDSASGVPTSLTSTSNFYGFTGISFDEIFVQILGGNGAMMLDNIQMGQGAAAVPEPASMVIWGVGALGMGLVARRRVRKASAM